MDLCAVREALADAASEVGDVDAKSFIPDSIAPPTVAVGRMQLTYDGSFAGLATVVVTVHAFTAWADAQQSQEDLLPMLAPDGMKAALEADRTLGGVCQELRVESADGPGISEVGGQQFWSATWTVRVWG